MQAYWNNVIPKEKKQTFNLEDHSDYLELVMSGEAITKQIVFNKEDGKKFLKKHGVKNFSAYEDSWKTNIPHTSFLANGLTGRTRP